VELVERTLGEAVIIDVHGPMVRDEAEPFVLLAALRAALERGHSCLVLNVAEVSSVDSLWLGAVVQGFTTAVRKGGTIKLVHVSKRFRELLGVTKLDHVFEVFESEDDAIATKIR
jgi:anti-sigma B factor antagonist